MIAQAKQPNMSEPNEHYEGQEGSDTEPESSGFVFATTDDIFKRKPREWVIPGKALKTGVTHVFGDSGIGKTYYMQTLAAALGQPVIYVATEGDYTIASRMKAWRKFNKQVTDQMRWFTEPLDLSDENLVGEFIEAARPIKPVMIVIDVFSDCIGDSSENDSSNMAKVIRHMKMIAQKLDCAVVFVHHTTKATDGYRGSSVLYNNVDVVIQIKEAGDGGILVINEKNKAMPKWDIERWDFVTVELDNGHSDQVIVPAQMVYRETSKESRNVVLKALQENSEGLTRGKLKTITHLGESTLKNVLLKQLLEDGLIAYAGRGKPYMLTTTGFDMYKSETLARSALLGDSPLGEKDVANLST